MVRLWEGMWCAVVVGVYAELIDPKSSSLELSLERYRMCYRRTIGLKGEAP